MSRVHLTRRALSQLAAIHESSVANWGEATAEAYLDELERGLTRLADYPDLLGAPPQPGLRLRFYRIREHTFVCDRLGDQVYVVAVWHGSMDLIDRLAELEPTLAAEADWMARRIEGQAPSNEPE